MEDVIYGVIIFVTVIILVFVSILTYSKAYKAKNRIIEIIEKYESYESNLIKEELNRIGYTIANKDKIINKCGENNLSNESGYLYCVYEKELSNGKIYSVVTYVNFNIPIVGTMFEFPVKGETKILDIDYDY